MTPCDGVWESSGELVRLGIAELEKFSVGLVVGFVFDVGGFLYSCRRKCRRFEKANVIAVIKIISSVTRVSRTIYYVERVH